MDEKWFCKTVFNKQSSCSSLIFFITYGCLSQEMQEALVLLTESDVECLENWRSKWLHWHFLDLLQIHKSKTNVSMPCERCYAYSFQLQWDMLSDTHPHIDQLPSLCWADCPVFECFPFWSLKLVGDKVTMWPLEILAGCALGRKVCEVS